ncbi:hypothetical protein J1N35_029270 [Gossypium stocksii]|uniref:DUF4283 domain-containing protein n=1 Tax=Gossypium stocksii TaxID=47602 RepID=A0A9D3ZT01_9ROSI|nr:hypothetical protein J1N35_029270 [Gossypium stocksii]
MEQSLGGSGVGRATKKVRRRDDDLPDVGDMETDDGGSKVASFKDKLLGWNPNESIEEDYEEDEFELLDRDSDDERNSRYQILGKSTHSDSKEYGENSDHQVSGRKIGFYNLISKLHLLWKPRRSLQLMDLENDYYFVKFQSKEDYNKALIEGPWTIYGQYLIVQPWSSSFNTSQSLPN